MKKIICSLLILTLSSGAVTALASENISGKEEDLGNNITATENVDNSQEKIIGIFVVTSMEAGVRTRPLISDSPSHWFNVGEALPLYQPDPVYYNGYKWYMVCKPGTTTYIGYVLASDGIIR